MTIIGTCARCQHGGWYHCGLLGKPCEFSGCECPEFVSDDAEQVRQDFSGYVYPTLESIFSSC